MWGNVFYYVNVASFNLLYDGIFVFIFNSSILNFRVINACASSIVCSEYSEYFVFLLISRKSNEDFRLICSKIK